MIRETLPARREARWLLAGVLLSSIGRGLTLPFLFIYLTDVRGLSDAAAGIAIGWFGAVVMVLAPLGGTLMDRFGARPVALVNLVAQAAGSALIAFGLLLMTCGYAQIEVGFAAFSVRVADVGPRVVAWAMAATTIVGISSVVGPVTAGPLIGAGHAGVWVFLTLGGCLVASALALSLRSLLTPDQDGTPSIISGHR